MLKSLVLNPFLKRTAEFDRYFKVFIRKYHQFKPKDKIQAYDTPLPHDIQVSFYT